MDAQFLETAEDELDYTLKSAPRGPHLPTTRGCWHLIIVIVNKEYLSISMTASIAPILWSGHRTQGSYAILSF